MVNRRLYLVKTVLYMTHTPYRLVRSKHPGLAPADVKRLIESTAVDLGDRGADKVFGNGRIDAFATLSK